MKKNLRSIFNKFIKKTGIKARDGKQVYICEEFHQKISLMLISAVEVRLP